MKMNAVFALLASSVVSAGMMAIGCGRSEQGAAPGQRSPAVGALGIVIA